MPINEQAARIAHHTSTTTGAFTVPASEDFTDGSWDKFDLAKSEIGVNEADDKAYIRIGANIKELGFSNPTESFAVACGDETTVLTVAAGLVTFRMPYAFNLTEVRASLTTAGTGAALVTVIINVNAVNIFSSGGTAITFDATEKTSTTATTPNVIGISAIADDAEITVDVTQLDTDNVAAGLKIYLIGNKT